MKTCRSTTSRRLLHAITAALLFFGISGAILIQPLPAAAVGSPVLIDDFGGTYRGTRDITPYPLPQTSTTAPATYTESGGKLTTKMGGNGNSPARLQLDYDFPSTDLTSGGSNTQFFLEFSSIERLPEVTPGETALQAYIQVTDTAGVKASYGTGIANVNAFNIVLNFDCTTPGAVCFQPATVNFTKITHVQVLLSYPTNYDNKQSLTAVLDTIRTTPTGGIVPSAPAAQVTGPSSPVYGPTGTTLDFSVAFTSDGQGAAVTHTPGTDDGLRAQDISALGTAPGSDKLVVTGGPSTYQVRVGPLTGNGSVSIGVPAGIVTDAWGQKNKAGNTATVSFAIAVPASITQASPPDGTVGASYSYSFRATGTPSPTWALAGGSVPPGLTLSRSGILSGTPTAGGPYSFRVQASNGFGTDTEDVTMEVNAPPAITSASAVTTVVGQNANFTVTATGYPTPRFSATGLPSGLRLDDNRNGSATLSGTPTGPTGTFTANIAATNSASTATQALVITVRAAPTIVLAGDATFSTLRVGSYTIKATGDPTPGISTSALPAGLTFVDAGNGTATISGTPTGPGGRFPVTVTAQNSVGRTIATLTVVVTEPPTITSSNRATFTLGKAGSFTIATRGYPTPRIAVNQSQLPAGLTLTDNGNGTATLAGTPTGTAGDTTLALTATNSDGTGQQALLVRVQGAPAITSAATATFTTAVAGSFVVTATGFPTPVLGLEGALPSGLSFTDNGDGTGTISGTPTGPGGKFLVTVTSQNAAGRTTAELSVIVTEPPTITSGPRAIFTLGESGSFTIATLGYPAPSITAVQDEIPAGLTLTDNGNGTATLAGTPTGPAGDTTLALTVTNSAGTGGQALLVRVQSAPAITSAATATFTTGVAGSFAVTATGFPAPVLGLDGALPEGLGFSDNGDGTGTISGTATTVGQTTIQVIARNDEGTAVQDLVLVVNSKPVFTSADQVTFAAGEAKDFTITTAGDPDAVITAGGELPPGLTLTDNGDGTATLAGTATTSGSYGIALTATNAAGVATAILTVNITAPPSFSSVQAALTFGQGTAGSGTIASTGFPVATLTESGALPAGLTFTDNGDGTATIAGSPTEDGAFTVTVTATNANGTATSQVSITVTSTPSFDSPSSASFAEGVPGSFTVKTAGFPPPAITQTGTLPKGLSFADHGDGTATISGTPAVGSAGSYPVTITATSTAPGSKIRAKARAAAAAEAATSQSLTLTVAGPSASPTPSPSSSSEPTATASATAEPVDDGSDSGNDDGDGGDSGGLANTGGPELGIALLGAALLAGGAVVGFRRNRGRPTR